MSNTTWLIFLLNNANKWTAIKTLNNWKEIDWWKAKQNILSTFSSWLTHLSQCWVKHCKDNVHLLFPLFFFLKGNSFHTHSSFFFLFNVVSGTRTHKSDLVKVLVSVKVYNKEAKLAEVGDFFYYANTFYFDVLNCHGYNNVYTTEERFCLLPSYLRYTNIIVSGKG